ncbi:MAG: hypothetical protein HY238_01545, partial [Acidobacteria bacterium]|nr:hypothetical protein [Acidobacteriota bacterium]
KAPGVDAPRTVDPAEWFEILARNLPGDKNFATGFMCHMGADWERLERMISFLAARLESFRVASLDPESYQWRPENAPLAFYRRTYGVRSLAEVRSMNAPLKRIRALSEKSAGVPGPGLWGAPPPQVATEPAAKIVRPQSLTADQILEAADYLLGRWPQGTHDGDLGAPPALLQTSRGALSLADAFEALTASLVEQRKRGRLPGSVRLRRLRGPVDFPVFDLKAEPKLDPEKAKTGYMPHEIPRESMPEDPDVVNAQGLPPCGDFHVWMPTHTKVEAGDMMAAVERVSGQLAGHVPGVISVRMLTEDSRGKEPRWLEMKVNPAEFLYALAQEYRAIRVGGKPGPVVMVSMKVAGSQRCQLIIPYTADTSRGAAVGAVRFEGFIWRAKMSVEELDRAWTTGVAGTRR